MARLLMICLGGFVGTGMRYGLNGWVARRYGETFPWGTLLINVTGSFLAGIAFYLTGVDSPVVVSATARQVILAGLLGGFTTFSSFSIQALALLQEGEFGAALGNIFGSVLAGLVAAWLGFMLARSLGGVR